MCQCPQAGPLLCAFQIPQGWGQCASTEAGNGVYAATLPVLASCRADPLAMGGYYIVRGCILLALSLILQETTTTQLEPGMRVVCSWQPQIFPEWHITAF